MNTPRINRFLGEWLDRQTSPNFFQEGLILLNACDFIDSNSDAIPGLIAHKKSPLHQQLDEAIASRGYCYLKPIEVNAQDSIEVEKYYRFETIPKGSNEPITYYGLGAYFICRAIFNNEFDIDSGFQYDDEELFYEDIGFDALFHNKSVFLLGDILSDDMEVSWQEIGISMRRRAFN